MHGKPLRTSSKRNGAPLEPKNYQLAIVALYGVEAKTIYSIMTENWLSQSCKHSVYMFLSTKASSCLEDNISQSS